MSEEPLDDEFLPDYCKAKVLVLGCGNVLFGDDGFGPKFIRYYEDEHGLPECTEARDAHTSVKNLLFDLLLSDVHPELIIIVDAVDKGRTPGEIFEINLEDIPVKKKDDFSMHQMPTSDILAEIKGNGKIDVRVLVAQVENIPDEVAPGLSKVIEDAIPKACVIVDKWVKELDQ